MAATIEELDKASWLVYDRPFDELDCDLRSELREDVEEGADFSYLRAESIFDPADNGNQGS